MSVDAAGVWSPMVGEGVDVGGFEFAGFTVAQNIGDDGVVVCEGRESLLIGFELARFCFLGLFDKLHLAEEDLAKLLG